jgi:hypothetical protein
LLSWGAVNIGKAVQVGGGEEVRGLCGSTSPYLNKDLLHDPLTSSRLLIVVVHGLMSLLDASVDKARIFAQSLDNLLLPY